MFVICVWKNVKKCQQCVFAGQDQLVALVEVFIDQHLLLAAAGVDPSKGLEGYYARLGETLQI